MGRAVSWDGFANARDLGGLPLLDGGTTARHRVFRSATLRFVTGRGWDEARAAGLRTVVDLRNDDEVDPRPGAAPSGSAAFRDGGVPAGPPRETDHVRLPLDDVEDVALWSTIRSEGIDGTPLYFGLFVERKPERCADAVRAVARARPGGVLFHCGAGRDRAGLLALLLLSLVGVTREAIAEDYASSTEALPPLFAAMGVPDQGPLLERALRAHGTSVHDAVLDVLDRVDVEVALRDWGLSDSDVAAARARLLP